MANLSPDDISALLPFYILGNLSETERQQVEDALARDPALRATLTDMQQALDELPYHSPPVQPGAHVKRDLLARLAAESRPAESVAPPATTPPPASGFSQLIAWLQQNLTPTLPQAMVGLAALLVLIWVGAGLRQTQQQMNTDLTTQLAQQATAIAALDGQLTTLNDQLTDLAADNASLQATLTSQAVTIAALSNQLAPLAADREELELALGDQHEVLMQVSSPESAVMGINGLGDHAAAHGHLVANPTSGSAVLLVAGLPPLPEGHTYQFWFLRDGQPVSAGSFEVGEDGRGLLVIDLHNTILDYDTMGVSIEPDTGSPAPTTDMVMMASISS